MFVLQHPPNKLLVKIDTSPHFPCCLPAQPACPTCQRRFLGIIATIHKNPNNTGNISLWSIVSGKFQIRSIRYRRTNACVRWSIKPTGEPREPTCIYDGSERHYGASERNICTTPRQLRESICGSNCLAEISQTTFAAEVFLSAQGQAVLHSS